MRTTGSDGQVNAVRRVRRAAEMTQAELAAAVGVTRQTIVALEQGNYAPSVYLALAISRRLDSTVESLFDPAHPHSHRRERVDESTH